MPTFTVMGPNRVPVYQGKACKTITTEEASKFWEENLSVAAKRGCYVFAIRAGGGITPIYVGKATKSFQQEVFTPHKLTKYQQALADYVKGTPIVFFLALKTTKGAPNKAAIKELEDFLIQTAVSVNPDLLNVRGTKRADWEVTGVIRSGVGRPSKGAKALKKCLGF